jgi:beta-lactam-binding protein with PASTA domain
MMKNVNHRNSYIKQEPEIKKEKENIKVEELEVIKIPIKKAKVQIGNLYDLTKEEQIEKLKEYKVPMYKIKKLRYEKDRVNELFKLINGVE